MSASLVGSEMCIRDRSFTRVQGESVHPHLGMMESSWEGPCVGKHPRAVSYTHLTLPTICSV
eukprot:10908173-Alexandrium_andersonii.AAC.1